MLFPPRLGPIKIFNPGIDESEISEVMNEVYYSYTHSQDILKEWMEKNHNLLTDIDLVNLYQILGILNIGTEDRINLNKKIMGLLKI